jgi:hypothetical protein
MTRYITLIFLIGICFLAACSGDAPELVQTSTPEPTGSVSNTTQTPNGLDRIETATPGNETQQPTITAVPPLPTITPTETVAIQVSGPGKYPEGYNPLTGLPANNPASLERRPVSVKIQLYPRNGRPPWGISFADIVYDFYQNDGLTRLHAVFYENDAEMVGPIRSARIFDEDLMRMYKTIFAFGGADWRVFNRIYDADLRELMVVEGARNCPPMCRIDPNGYNYLVTNTEELRKYADENGVDIGRQDLEGMSFDVSVPDNGDPVNQVELRWSISSYVKWEYDPESGKYARYQDSAEAGDRSSEQFASFSDQLNNEQIKAENVVVIPLNHVDLYPQNNFEVIEIQLPPGGNGTAYAFRDGQMYEVTWNRPTTESVIYLTASDGSAFPLKPGNTWFEIMGKNSFISEVEPGVYRFEFRY